MARVGLEAIDMEPFCAALASVDRLMRSRHWPPRLAQDWERMFDEIDLADVEWVRGRWLAVPSPRLESLIRVLADCPRRHNGSARTA